MTTFGRHINSAGEGAGWNMRGRMCSPEEVAGPLGRIFRTFRFGAPIFSRLSASSRPQSRLQVGAPDRWHFMRSMKYPGWAGIGPQFRACFAGG